MTTESGLHASRHPAGPLHYALGALLHRVEVADIVEAWDRSVAKRLLEELK